jgi:hypothetical protein
LRVRDLPALVTRRDKKSASDAYTHLAYTKEARRISVTDAIRGIDDLRALA